jgi:hypothetical protein
MSGATATPPPAVVGSGSTSTTPSAATSCLPTAAALHQLRHAPRLVTSRLHRLCINYVVRLKYSSPGCSGSTSLTPRVRVPRHLARLVAWLVTRLVVDYFTYVVRPVASAHRAARRRPHAVSPLNFSSVGCTGSRRVPGQSTSRLDYSWSGLHRLYCAYVVHPDAPSRHSTSPRSVALALVVRPVTASRGATTCRPDCTGSTAPMLCIRTRRLDASTSRRSVALALAVRLVTASRGATTRRPDCTGSTAPMPCIWTRHLDARFLIS